MGLLTAWSLSLSITDIQSWRILCCGDCPMYCRLFINVPYLYLLDAELQQLKIFPDITKCSLGRREKNSYIYWLVNVTKYPLSCCSVPKFYLTLCNPWTQHTRLPSPSLPPSLLKLMFIESVMPSNHLILFTPFFSLEVCRRNR